MVSLSRMKWIWNGQFLSACINCQLQYNLSLSVPTGSLKRLTTLKVDDNQLMYLPDTIGG